MYQRDRTVVVDDRIVIRDQADTVSVHLFEETAPATAMAGTELLTFEKLYPPASTGDGGARQYYTTNPKLLVRDPSVIPEWIQQELRDIGYDLVQSRDVFDDGQPLGDDDQPTVGAGRNQLEQEGLSPEETQGDYDPSESASGSTSTSSRASASAGSSTTADAESTSSTRATSPDPSASTRDDAQSVPSMDETGTGSTDQDTVASEGAVMETREQDDDNMGGSESSSTDAGAAPATTQPTPSDRTQPTLDEVKSYQASFSDERNLSKIDGIGVAKQNDINEAGIDTIEQLQLLTADQIAELPNIGQKLAQDIKDQVGDIDPDELDGFEYGATAVEAEA